ncbi:hypothetical protein C0033_17685 [Clostridium sp. chh4-2]|uniref:lipopolysaccharide biosynthesis protein n=1 Tax=Clostridium sp. chh4-2 TaxID=2067550 RepID=UPI000CCF4706|nr:oligosaccharide flippase family protein [Clostridium sp. chh4-2]PNV60596.1 hypothetical protein C0033_17685 [Clostridium sp. chh4-2]
MNNNYKELKKNTYIIAIANLGSKIIAFVLAPLYSYYMSVSQYGIMDIITSTITLIVPFVVFDIYEATFRYSNDKKYSSENVFSTSIVACIPGIILCLLCAAIFHIASMPFYLEISCICVLLTSFNCVLKQFVRGTGNMLGFAISGVICSLFLLVGNYIFLVLFRLELRGWLYSYLIGIASETLYLLIISNFKSKFSFANFEANYLREFIVFCMPLLPTTVMWWIMSLSDRYMLSFFSGTAATGIYAVANKLPSMLSVFENIFYQAWQTTAINTKDDENRDEIYSSVFNKYINIMLVGVLGVLVVARPMVDLLFEKSYTSAYRSIPILVLAVVIHAINGNLGSLYTVFKNTNSALISTVIGAVINILLNVIMIPFMGVLGASLTTVIGYSATLIYRWINTKRFVTIHIEKRKVFGMLLLVVISFMLYYTENVISYAIRGTIFIAAAMMNFNTFRNIVKR